MILAINLVLAHWFQFLVIVFAVVVFVVYHKVSSLCYTCTYFTGYTQLRILCEDDLVPLLPQALPSEWAKGNTVSWYPEDRNHNHPPRGWIKVVWRYLQEYFTDAQDIRTLGKLPLIPLSMSQTPVILTRLCDPSRVVVKRLHDYCLDDTVSGALIKLGLVIMSDYPTFISHHPAVIGRFINPPSAQGVLKAMVVSSSRMEPGKLSEIVRTELSTKEKQLLRLFLANARTTYMGPEEYNLLCSLPVFETLSKEFVSKEDGLSAAPTEPLPISPIRELIDITQEDSWTLARLLNVSILEPMELLCQVVFPDIARGCYSGEQIDKLMSYVLDHYANVIRNNVNFKTNVQNLAFVSKEKGRAKACELFDPRSAIIKTLFVYEDVFPTFTYANPSVLVLLEELGMKSECAITGNDLCQSSNMISKFPQRPSTEQKSKAILQYLSDNPQKLVELVNGQPLWELLSSIPWVSRLEQKPYRYPPSLPWWETEEENRRFFKPVELKSHQVANLVGTVMPLVNVDTSNQIGKYFGWQKEPDVLQVVRHLKTAVRWYSQEEKPYYIMMLNEIYRFLGRADYGNVSRAFDWTEEFSWIWNGDGFSLPCHLLSTKPPIDLAPYILCLPSDMMTHSRLFKCFGMREESDPAVLVQVLNIIKQKRDDRSVPINPLDVKHDLQLSVNILNELADNELSEELQADIVIPIHLEDNSCVRLEPLERCMYCEHEWLKKDGEDEDIDYFYVHRNVPNKTAESLGVPSLTHRMLNLDELSIGEEYGQEERLTIRLNRLLEEYTDGFSVVKELIQNADDAGATEVKFLYDERTNEDAMTCLIDKGMKGYQGPALWVYNDAKFTDEDFENITKLSEATKWHDTEKIGRFGLGFNAVYNLTDVPMFISNNYFVMFDPHTSNLGKVIKNKRKPGIKIDLNKDVKNLRKFANQFKPFNGIFGCDLHLDKEDNSFDGTLFRFPLRTKEQAVESEIKKLHYDDNEMRELLQMLLCRAKSLLLFTQNILRVGIYRLPKMSSQHAQPWLMFEVCKSLSQKGVLRELSFPVKLPVTADKLDDGQQRFLKQCSFLQGSSRVTRDAKCHPGDPSKFPKCSIAVDVDCSFTKLGLEFFNAGDHFDFERVTWLVVSTMGNGQAMQFAKDDESLLPLGGVAVQLVPTGNNFLPLPIVQNGDTSVLNGIIFCYLPLPIRSGLPLHINGAFAVAANRRHLQVEVEDDKQCYGVNWNNVLMQDSISSAYLCLLEDVKSIAPDDGSYKFHSLWPKADEVHRDCWPILKSFYTQLASGGYPLFSDGRVWVELAQTVFLDPELRTDPQIGDTTFAVFQTLFSKGEVVIDLPKDVFKSLTDCDMWCAIKASMYDKRRFFHELLFPNFSKVPSDLRDVLVLHALDNQSGDFDELLKTHACIPASPRGETFKCPGELVHPKREASALFSPDDGRFPHGTADTFLNRHRLTKLEELGMVSNDLSWKEIAERAEAICRINEVNSKAAVKRVEALLEFMERNIKGKSKAPPPLIAKRLQEAKFLSVLRRPKAFPLPWKGDEFQYKRKFLVAPKDVFLEENKYLVCCTEPLVHLHASKKVKDLLKLSNKDATVQHVMRQLEQAMSTNITLLDEKGYDEVCLVCEKGYSFLQKAMTTHGQEIKEFLLESKFILVGKIFLSADRVAVKISANCLPYLYKLPDHLADSFTKIMKFAGVRDHFEEGDYISSLQLVQLQFQDMQLDEKTLEVTITMAIQLGEKLKQSSADLSEVQRKWGTIFLPDSRKVMRPVTDLCIKDCLWMPNDPSVEFANDKIPWPTCSKLGVKTRIEEALKPHEDQEGIEYGQVEKLTNRLKRIIAGYRCEKEILKELLQNADDAQATEIWFIKDARYHPDDKVLNDSWKPLQGPALCVYNNKPFTKADIAGIKNLGQGSKGDDPIKTGQYGIGFNAVYHLTDVPSFMSGSEEIGDVLCVFDPHCIYVPHATETKPGRMYRNIEEMRKKFPDVFSCYLEDHFPIKNATMFRFPLKSEQMAEKSEISSAPVTVEKLDEMMEELKSELFEVLLFVNNVKKISLCSIDEKTGNLVNTYSVQAVLSQEDDKTREEFADRIKEIGGKAKENGNLPPTSIQVNKCIYPMKLRDTSGREEKWLIVQQVGFEKPVEKSILDAYKRSELGMLPRGGVASLLECTSSRKQLQRKTKAYCFLPLPFETDLPVHINGHFVLDHETRRNLWRAESGDYRSDWNNSMLRDVIASCYLTLLAEVRAFLQLPTIQDNAESCSMNYCMSTIIRRLSTYEELFPRYPIDDPHWKTLVDTVYQEMSRKRMRLIPSVRNAKNIPSCRSGESNSSQGVLVTWFPPTGTGKDKSYFNDLEIKGCFAAVPPRFEIKSKDDEKKRRKGEEKRQKRKSRFVETLIETGFNLVAFSLTVFDSFQEAGVEVFCISPSAVMDFYKSFTDPDPLCNIGKIPCPVNRTPFKDEKGVIRVLKYCKDGEQFLQNLSGLPLLLTQDNYLNVFSERDPRCVTHYQDIVPCSKSMFVHKEVRCEIFGKMDWRRTSVFRPLDAETLASCLHKDLPHICISKDQFVRWCPDNPSGILPNQRWIYRVWNFLQEFAKDVMKKKEVDKKAKEATIHDLLLPLSEWSLLPATQMVNVERSSTSCSLETVRDTQRSTHHFLVPLSKSEAVLDVNDSGTSDPKLVDVLKSMGLPILHSAVITTITFGKTSYTRTASYHFVRNLVASLKEPASLLIALKRHLQSYPLYLEEKLQPADATVVLEYFNRNAQSLTDIDKETLRKLPFYPTSRGGLVKLEDSKTCVIPDELPKEDMDVIESRMDCVFLKYDPRLSELYKCLDVEEISPVDAYLEFVLKCFQHLSHEGKLAHIRYIRQFCSSASAKQNSNEEVERQRLIDCLKKAEFIPTNDGRLMTASSFYDPRNAVFSCILSEESFPPAPFQTEEWLMFLETIGLIKDVSRDDFKTFAIQVANEAATVRTENTYKKSIVLVQYLFSRHDVVSEGLLRLVCNIPFVAADPVDQALQDLCPPYGELRDGEIPYIAFRETVSAEHEEIVWTEAQLLPSWADPKNQKRDLGCPDSANREKYCKDVLSQLQIQSDPSVDTVFAHCRTICVHLERERKGKAISAQKSRRIMSVMNSIYGFLTRNLTKFSLAMRKAAHIPCILVEDGRRFIFPNQAVLELYENLEIKPFLYKVPPRFGVFQGLFKLLGCSKSVTTRHYALVLKILHEQRHGEVLDPEDGEKCFKAVKEFFERLQYSEEDVSSLSELYLPAEPLEKTSSNSLEHVTHVSLYNSKTLIFDDAPSLRNRIQSLVKLFVFDLGAIGVKCKSVKTNYRELMMKLPTALRPSMLSSVVKERLKSSDGSGVITSGPCNLLRQRLSSGQFGRGIVRLICHENCEKNDFEEDVIAVVKSDLQKTEILAVENLTTTLFYNGDPIPDSDSEVSYLLDKVGTAHDAQAYRLYLNAGNGLEEIASTIVSKVAVNICGGLVRETAYLIPGMLQCTSGKIKSFLDSMEIRRDDFHGDGMDDCPDPGIFIPIKDHHLLNDAFEEFEPGECVGYEQDDPSLQMEEGGPTYIYAVVVEEVTDENAPVLLKKYTINIGLNQETKVVDAVDLYKIHHLQAITSSAISFEQEAKLSRNMDTCKLFHEISEKLEVAWKQPDVSKRKIFKRLYMYWHPKKSFGNEELCKEVWHFIQSEIERLEREDPPDSNRGNSGHCIVSWDVRAKTHHIQRQEYRENISRQHEQLELLSDGSAKHIFPPTFSRENPQPEEAKRWFKQAQNDVNAAENDITSSQPFYEWACFKCHQVSCDF